MSRTRVFLLLMLLASSASAVTLTHTGYLLGASDAPVTGDLSITYRLYDTNGATLWTATVPTHLDAGYYAVELGAAGQPAIGANVFDGSIRLLGITLPGAGELTPRLTVAPATAASLASRALNADTLEGQSLTQLRAEFASKTETNAKVASVSVASGGGLALTGTATDPTLAVALQTSAPLSGAGTTASPLAIALQTSAPLSGAGTAASPLQIATANGTQPGALSAADWTTFNAKVTSLTAGNGVTITGDPKAPTISVSGASSGTTSTSTYGRPSRQVSGFSGEAGPDLSWEGWTQCYGWHNNGTNVPPSYTYMRDKCSLYKQVLFAGNRASSGTLIRHQVEFSGYFRDFLPATVPSSTNFSKDFDVARRYSWYVDGNWFLLTRYNNAWSDPGRLWEPSFTNNATYIAATGGHVLSQEGDQANDQNTVTGDRYFIYVRDAIPSSCAQILAANTSATSGTYTISIDGATSLSVYCDMTDGGWTMLMNQVSSSLLTADQNDVNIANFGSNTTTWRVGATTTKVVRPATAWKLTDNSNSIYFKPTCVVDWAVSYLNQPASDCTTAYTSAAFSTAVNGGFINVGTRGIGINNSGQNCSMRAYDTTNGRAYSCAYTNTETVRLWFK